MCKQAGGQQQGPPGCQLGLEDCAWPPGFYSLCSSSHGDHSAPIALSPWMNYAFVCALVTAAEGHPLALSNPKVQGRSCGALHVRAFSAVTRPSFLDYLRSGAEISFMVAVVSQWRGLWRGGSAVRDAGSAEG